ncbi:ELL-associated factor 1-like [Oscarella lobularis]|uniref:ELL-associated factor 1-like n=1 Tax=Oscarella lobularis TaxID=121494 RepID=UPI0033137B27
MELQPDREYDLRLGESFSSNSSISFHKIRYDFKPASTAESTDPAELKVKPGGHVSLTVPSGQDNVTEYQGSDQPLQKECVLIVDEKTGTVTLEKLTSYLQLKQVKRMRENGSKTVGAKKTALTNPVTPLAPDPIVQRTSATTVSAATATTVATSEQPAAAKGPSMSSLSESGSSSSGSDSSDDDDDDDDDDEKKEKEEEKPEEEENPFIKQLTADLAADLAHSSESDDESDDSDSDDDS